MQSWTLILCKEFALQSTVWVSSGYGPHGIIFSEVYARLKYVVCC